MWAVFSGALLLGQPWGVEAAGSRLALVGLVNFADVYLNRQGSPDFDTSRKLGYGGGVLFELGASEKFGAETGLLYIQRNYEYGTGLFRVEQTASMLQIPLLLRYWLSDFVSFGAGGYAAFGLGSLSNQFKLGDTTVAGFDTSSRNAIELGISIAATLNFALAEKSGFFFEGRYSRGLTDISKDDTVDQHLDDLAILAGIRFDFAGGSDSASSE